MLASKRQKQIEMWQSSNSNSTTFELRTYSRNSKFDECFKRFVVECQFVGKILVLRLICIMHKSQRVQINLSYSQIQPITQTTVIECATWFLLTVVLHCILIWRLILWTLRNNILLQSLIHLNQCWQKKCLYIRIRIRRILKVRCEFWPTLSHY